MHKNNPFHVLFCMGPYGPITPLLRVLNVFVTTFILERRIHIMKKMRIANKYISEKRLKKMVDINPIEDLREILKEGF